MKIANYNVTMESKHLMTQTHTFESQFKFIDNAPKEIDAKDIKSQLRKDALTDYLELSKKAMDKLRSEAEKSKEGLTVEDIVKLDIPDRDKQKLLLLAELVKRLTGKEIKIILPKEIKLKQIPIIPQATVQNYYRGEKPAPKELNWAAQYKSSETYSESEYLSFKAGGVINTSDGKQIEFDVQLNMSRSLYYQNNVDIRLGNARLLDPLVINFDAPAASVTQTSFNFDIDCDGNEENLSTLNKGSGFLALDNNGDGEINDGSELFGTKSGNGFHDLSYYDSDNNNWIDENDSIFTKLKIWCVNEDGTRDLFSLQDKGIGAIYLGNIDGAFSMTNNSGEQKAQANTAGIFLKEDGTPGIMQQIDYVV